MNKNVYTIIVPEEFEELLEELRIHYRLKSKSEVIRIALGVLKTAKDRDAAILAAPKNYVDQIEQLVRELSREQTKE